MLDCRLLKRNGRSLSLDDVAAYAKNFETKAASQTSDAASSSKEMPLMDFLSNQPATCTDNNGGHVTVADHFWTGNDGELAFAKRNHSRAGSSESCRAAGHSVECLAALDQEMQTLLVRLETAGRAVAQIERLTHGRVAHILSAGANSYFKGAVNNIQDLPVEHAEGFVSRYREMLWSLQTYVQGHAKLRDALDIMEWDFREL